MTEILPKFLEIGHYNKFFYEKPRRCQWELNKHVILGRVAFFQLDIIPIKTSLPLKYGRCKNIRQPKYRIYSKYVLPSEVVMQSAICKVDIEAEILKISGRWDKKYFVLQLLDALSKWRKIYWEPPRVHRFPLFIEPVFLVVHLSSCCQIKLTCSPVSSS